MKDNIIDKFQCIKCGKAVLESDKETTGGYFSFTDRKVPMCKKCIFKRRIIILTVTGLLIIAIIWEIINSV